MELSGVVNLYKEKGFTSQDALRVLKGILKGCKVGHTGTLDPDATGVLPVCVGKATKAAEIITGTDKSYRATLVFGSETDTEDASGQVTKTYDYTFDEAKVREVCASFVGEQAQIPPMYSAIWVDGRRLYDLARKGIEVEREPRKITIHSLEIVSLSETEMTFDVTCSKGTYIRTLCADIGRKCGYGAHMSALERTASGPYRIEDSLTLKQIEERMAAGDTESFLTDLSTLFSHLRAFRVDQPDDVYLKSGNFLTYPVSLIDGERGEMIRMELSGGQLAALYKVSEHLTYKGEPSVRLRAFKMFM